MTWQLVRRCQAAGSESAVSEYRQQLDQPELAPLMGSVVSRESVAVALRLREAHTPHEFKHAGQY